MGQAKKAGTKMERYETLRTPKGTAGFSYLQAPDEKFGAKHRIQLFIDKDDPEAKEFVKKLLATKAKYLASIKKTDDKKIPGLKKADAYLAEKFAAYGVKEGSLYFEFSSNARKVDGTDDWQHIETYDASNKLNPDIRVFGGDIVRVSTTLMGYNTGKEVGIKAYLNAVQMLMKKSQGGRVNPFADESSEFAAETSAEAPAEEGTGFETEEPATKPVIEAKPTKKTKAAAPKDATPPSETEGVDLADLV